jgi:hypothetical protein
MIVQGRALVDFRLIRVAAARHVGGHVLWLRFDDGLEGEVDLTDGLRGTLLEPLEDVTEFARVRVVDGILTWPSGGDWATENLYERVAANRLIAQSRDDVPATPAAILSAMPEISRFFGVVIRMLANDHAPPHFHAQYGEYEVTVTIREGVVAGRFPGRALRLVLEWRDLHQDQLLANWDRLRAGEPPQAIEPLS